MSEQSILEAHMTNSAPIATHQIRVTDIHLWISFHTWTHRIQSVTKILFAGRECDWINSVFGDPTCYCRFFRMEWAAPDREGLALEAQVGECLVSVNNEKSFQCQHVWRHEYWNLLIFRHTCGSKKQELQTGITAFAKTVHLQWLAQTTHWWRVLCRWFSAV